MARKFQDTELEHLLISIIITLQILVFCKKVFIVTFQLRDEQEGEEQPSEPTAQEESYDPHLNRVTYRPVSYVLFKLFV